MPAFASLRLAAPPSTRDAWNAQRPVTGHGAAVSRRQPPAGVVLYRRGIGEVRTF